MSINVCLCVCMCVLKLRGVKKNPSLAILKVCLMQRFPSAAQTHKNIPYTMQDAKFLCKYSPCSTSQTNQIGKRRYFNSGFYTSMQSNTLQHINFTINHVYNAPSLFTAYLPNPPDFPVRLPVLYYLFLISSCGQILLHFSSFILTLHSFPLFHYHNLFLV